jgi:hypothetical protein
MRDIKEVMADINKRYDAYNDIHKMLTDNGWSLLREWDSSTTVGGSFTKDWQKISVHTYWDDDRIQLILNGENYLNIDWDYEWETKVSTIVDAIS